MLWVAFLPKWEGNQEEGMYVHMWLTHFAIQQKLTQHCKTIIQQLNFFSINPLLNA